MNFLGMGLLGRSIFREITAGAMLGTLLFSFVLFLQRVSLLFEQLIRGSASPKIVGYLFVLLIPFTLVFTIPVGVLVGVLIGLSRMSSDGEIVAMRAAGVSTRRLYFPVLIFALIGLTLSGACSLWLNPWAVRESYRVLNKIIADQITAAVSERVFAEQFPNKTIYVGNVIAGTVIRWRNVFIADMTPPEQRRKSTQESGDAPRITLAQEAIAVPDSAHNRIQLRLLNGSSHEVGKNAAEYYNIRFPTEDLILEAQRPEEKKAKAYTESDTPTLRAEAKQSVEADIELQRRLSLPPACLLLALVGVPLGVSSRKSSKSAAFVMTVFIAFLYFMAQVSLNGLSKEGRLSPVVAAWTPNVVLLFAGLIALARLEIPGDRDPVGAARSWVKSGFASLLERLRSKSEWLASRSNTASSFRGLPQIIDTYVLSNFFFYFCLMLASFVLLTQVFTFFELLSDIVRNKIPMARVGTYHLFLTPKLLYDSTPISVLVAVLIAFGVFSKNNEVTAFKACGVSVYRLAMPVLAAGLVLSGALFAFDHYVVPDANLIQDGIRNEIKGRSVRTYLRPDRQWIYGKGSRIFYFKYFDPTEHVMIGVHVYDLDAQSSRLTRHIFAERAQWQPGMETWIFQNGWVRNIAQRDFHQYQATTFPEIEERPDYFLKEEKQYKQMNFQQLASYIHELKQSGFDTVRLQVQFHRKFAVPLFALILAILATPFAFFSAKRGAMAAIGVSILLAIGYRAIGDLFEQVGNVNQLPPALAAWTPDVLFMMIGLYLMTRIRT